MPCLLWFFPQRLGYEVWLKLWQHWACKNPLSNFIDFQQNSFVRNKLTKLHPHGWKMFHVYKPMYIKFLAS